MNIIALMGKDGLCEDASREEEDMMHRLGEWTVGIPGHAKNRFGVRPMLVLLAMIAAVCTCLMNIPSASAAEAAGAEQTSSTSAQQQLERVGGGSVEAADDSEKADEDGTAAASDAKADSAQADASNDEDAGQSDAAQNGTATGAGQTGATATPANKTQADSQTDDHTTAAAQTDATVAVHDRAQAHMLANKAGGEVKLPADWDATMTKYFPDEVLRKLVDQEVRNEFPGEDLSGNSVDDILSWVTGPNNDGIWTNLYSAYKELGTSERIKSLNGVQYLTGLSELYVNSAGSGAGAHNVGLQMLAFPGVANGTSVPDLDLSYNNLHIFPSKLYPANGDVNLPITTQNRNIDVSQNYYHHTPTLTYVRDGKGGKQVTFKAGIYKLADDASYTVNDENTSLVPIFNQSSEKKAYDFSTISGLHGYNAKTTEGFTTVTGDTQAQGGQVVKNVQYQNVAANLDGGTNRDVYSFSYAYTMTIDYLSTVKQRSNITTLGDFTFKKTSATNTNLGLKGAEYRILRDGKYLQGTVKGSTFTATTNNGKLVTTADASKADTVTTDAKGEITVRGVPATRDGVEYEVEEVKAPEGYELNKKAVTVKVKVSADLKTQVTGGESDEQTITANSVTASAAVSSDWKNAASVTNLQRGQQNPNPKKNRVDYAKSGDEMTLIGTDSEPAQSTRTPSAYNGGADKFIKNGGSKVGLAVVGSDGGALPSGYEVISQKSTLKDGTGKTLKTDEGGNSLNTVTDAVNGIISGRKMTKVTDYYNVDTDAVYHDTASVGLNSFTVSDDGTGDVNVQRDKVKPVAVEINASKTLTSGTKDGERITGDELKGFTFEMTPDEDSEGKSPAYVRKVTTDENGNASWGKLNFDSVWWEKATKDVKACHAGADDSATADGCKVTLNYTVAELDDGKPQYQYDKSQHKVRIEVSETGTTKGLTVKVYVGDDTEPAATASSASAGEGETSSVSIPGEKLTFHNIKKVIDFGFTKTDAFTKAPLQGATFTLYQATDACDSACKAAPIDTSNPSSKEWTSKGSSTSDADGKVRFTELPGGHYRLVETKVPEGYVQVHGQWNVVIDLSKTNAKDQIEITAVNGVHSPAFAAENGGYSVANTPEQKIPATGGRGLMAYTIIGILLIGAGAGLTWRKIHAPTTPNTTISA